MTIIQAVTPCAALSQLLRWHSKKSRSWTCYQILSCVTCEWCSSQSDPTQAAWRDRYCDNKYWSPALNGRKVCFWSIVAIWPRSLAEVYLHGAYSLAGMIALSESQPGSDQPAVHRFRRNSHGATGFAMDHKPRRAARADCSASASSGSELYCL